MSFGIGDIVDENVIYDFIFYLVLKISGSTVCGKFEWWVNHVWLIPL